MSGFSTVMTRPMHRCGAASGLPIIRGRQRNPSTASRSQLMNGIQPTRPRLFHSLATIAVFFAILPRALAAQDAPACATVPAFSALDFWVGDWDVFVQTTKVGTNHIEKVLAGCAITESWRDANGGEGRSLFYYVPATKKWKQVWVTDRAMTPGGVKEKELIETLPDGGLRFQGSIALPDGTSYFDRTTLTPLPAGRVHQLIEASRDLHTWMTTFDATYVRTRSP
jgi:hypothetical protein